MKKNVLPPGIDEVMQKLKTCKNFEPNPMFTQAKKPAKKRR